MKKLRLAVLVAMTAILGSLFSDADAKAATNLVPNPSVETASTATMPQSWQNGKWGTNTASFSYLNSGHTGTHSVKTTMSGYSSGDAKWYFNAVTVTPGAYYAFSDWYQSNVATQLVAQFTKTDGTVFYQTLGTVNTSTSWKQATYAVAVPANVNKLSVLHVIAANGYLVQDDASLTLVSQPPSSGNPVPNPSVESSVSNLPVGWNTGKWGANTANFQYVSEGHTGSKSVKVTVSNYTDGDAKWMFQPQPLQSGHQYRFTNWYKTNTQPHVVAMFNMSDGSTKYFGLPQPMPASNASTTWQKYSDTFTVPSGTASVTVFMFVSSNGWVQTDDYSIENYVPVSFSRPLVSLTFDDGHEDNVNTALPVMQSKGFKSTQCYATQYIEDVAGGPEDVAAFANAGHEICSHTVTHPFLTQISGTQLTYELTHSQQYLKQISGQNVRNFASPYGDYNATVLNEIKKYYRSHRSVDEGYNSKDNFDMYRIRVQNVQLGTTLAEYQSWLNQAKDTKTWLVLLYHRVVPQGQNDGEQFDTNYNDFVSQMNALSASGVTVKTYDAALDEVVPQL